MGQLQTFLTNIQTDMTILGGIVTAVAICWGGFMFIFSEGNAMRAERAKGAIIMALVGLGIILLSTAIASLVTGAL